jgi:hypothetical protein
MTSDTQAKQLRQQLRRLRVERADWNTGRNLHWGQPWCHRRCANCPPCDGCATREYCRGRAAEISTQIEALEAGPEPVRPVLEGVVFLAQEALW